MPTKDDLLNDRRKPKQTASLVSTPFDCVTKFFAIPRVSAARIAKPFRRIGFASLDCSVLTVTNAQVAPLCSGELSNDTHYDSLVDGTDPDSKPSCDAPGIKLVTRRARV